MKETLKFVVDKVQKRIIKRLLASGYKWRCTRCNRVYKEKDFDMGLYDEYDEQGGKSLKMCVCGCELFRKLSESDYLKHEVQPEAEGTLIFKEHHAKYCECEKGKFWTGNSNTECHAEFSILYDRDPDSKAYLCSKSLLAIIILKSTEKELTAPDELGSVFLRLPQDYQKERRRL